MDKLIGTVRFFILAAVLGTALYLFGPDLLQRWNNIRPGQNAWNSEGRARNENELKEHIGNAALADVDLHGAEILNQAYPLAFGQLTYKKAELVGVGTSDGGYTATVRLHYQNLLRSPHYLEIAYGYDSQAGYRSSQFAKHTDIIAPKELTLGTLMRLEK